MTLTSRELHSSKIPRRAKRVLSIEPRGKKPLLETLTRSFHFEPHECTDLDTQGAIDRFLADPTPHDILWFIVPKLVTGAPGYEECVNRAHPDATTVVVLTAPVVTAPREITGTVVWSPHENPAPIIAKALAQKPRVSWESFQRAHPKIHVRHKDGFPAERRYLGFEG
jgi:hypothetical protein